jgi:hypothetical protein
MSRSLIAMLALCTFASSAFAADTNLPSRVVVQSSDTAPTCTTATTDGELCVQGDAEVRTNLVVVGTAAVTGAATMSSTLGVTGALTGLRKHIAGSSAYTVVAPDDCGAIITTATDTAVITLPNAAAANLGCMVTVINTGADGAALISVSAHSSDGIDGSCIGEGPAFVELSGTADKDLQNTKATANKGDAVTIVSDGSAGWYVLSCLGVWASQG